MWKPPASLRDRWVHDDFHLEHVAMIALLEGKLDRAGLGVHDGRVDMRAFDTPPGQAGPRPSLALLRRGLSANRPSTLRRVRIQSVDFTHARIPGLIFDEVTFVDCLFDRANLDNTKFAACRLENCSFSRADLEVVSLGQTWNPTGPVLPSLFIDCRFANTMFGFTFAYGSEFIRCDFTRARFKASHWYGVRFVDCAFAGEVKEAEFRATDPSARLPKRPEMLDGVDLSRTSLRDCEFYGLSFRETKFPQDGDHLVVEDYRCFLERAAALLAQSNSAGGKYTLRSMQREHTRLGPDQPRGMLNLTDRVDPWPFEDQMEIAAAFDEALAACGQAGVVMSRVNRSRPTA